MEHKEAPVIFVTDAAIFLAIIKCVLPIIKRPLPIIKDVLPIINLKLLLIESDSSFNSFDFFAKLAFFPKNT